MEDFRPLEFANVVDASLSKKLNCDGIFTLTTILNIPQPYRWSYQDLGFGIMFHVKAISVKTFIIPARHRVYM
ncbi:hypothetical protein GQ607_012053 [Colletotrichum asianum]|uniref:Uncharacterized protein n=1 Tax=Colletotrichum asianum TaxID=702518 RepID=A0A8H3W1P5_9PEZI|nr:hypothetical protein GQ607_012053 [Colletotrichum asianum]